MSAAADMAGAVLTAFTSLWPFAGDDPGADPATTIAGLDAIEFAAVEALPTTLVADTAQAVAGYRAVLALDDVPPELRTRALRRLAHLELETGLALRATTVDDAAARVHLQAAATRYAELLAAPSAAPVDGEDRLRYQHARVLDALGEPAAAIDELERLVAAQPDSPHAPEARFRLGERRFVEGRFEAAESAYAGVLAGAGADRFRIQALYKLGWSHYRQNEYAEGLDAFLDLLDVRFAGEGDPDLERVGHAERELIEDTLRVASLTVMRMDGPASLDAALAGRDDPAHGHLLYAALGGLLVAQERYRDAAGAFDAFAAAHPTHARAPLFQQAVIDAYLEGGFPTLVLEAKAEFVVRYGLDAPFWAGRDPGAHGEVTERLRGHLADLARHDHALAQAEDDAAARLRAVDWYRRLLSGFPVDPGAGEHAFLLGELLIESDRPGEAFVAYAASAWDHGPHEHAVDAGYAAVLAARARIDALAADELTEWTEIVAWTEAAADTSLRFARTWPGHPQAVPVLVAQAEQFFGAERFEDAIAVADLVLAHEPVADVAARRVAWTVSAHSEFDLGRFGAAEAAYGALAELPVDADLAAEIERRVGIAIFRQGEAARSAGNVDGAVHHFLRLADARPGTGTAANALYDAGALLADAGRWSEAAPVLERFRGAHGDHPLALDAARLIAVSLREDGRASDAAAEFERLAVADGVAADEQRRALVEASDLHEAAGDLDARYRVLETLLGRFPEPAGEALELRQTLADLAPAVGRPSARTGWLEAVIATDRALGAAATDRSRWLAAHAVLELAAPVRDAFAAAPLTAPLKDSLGEKRARMEAALDAYADAADYGVAPVVNAATHEIGALYLRLARDLMASERPDGLAEDALLQYELLLEEQAYPFEERAIEAWRANAARAADGGWDRWVRASFDRLAEIAPARYARTEKGDRLALALHE